jgi:hypothetical protein
VLVDAGRYLLNSRAYKPAAVIFQSLRGGTQLLPGIDLDRVRRTRAFDETVVSKQPAIAAFQRFVIAALNPANPDLWTTLLVPEARGTPVEQYRRMLLGIVTPSDVPAAQPSTWPWLADVLATATNFMTDGNEQAGYRIRVSNTNSKEAATTVAYVVKRGDQYLLVGLAGAAASSGEALAKAAAGDLPDAAKEPWFHGGRDSDTRDRNWSEHGHLQFCGWRSSEAIALRKR